MQGRDVKVLRCCTGAQSTGCEFQIAAPLFPMVLQHVCVCVWIYIGMEMLGVSLTVLEKWGYSG